MRSPSPTGSVALAVRPGRCVITQLPANGAERRQLQLGGALVLVIVTGRGRGGHVVTAAAATAAVQEGPAQRATQEKQQCGRHGGSTEEQQLGQEVEDGHGVLGNAGRHVGGNDVADVLGHHARAVDDGQRYHGAVHLALQPDLLLVAAHAGLLRAPDLARRHQRAPDGEEGGEAEVAAEAPPQTSTLVGQTQHIEHIRERGGYPDNAAFDRRLIRDPCVLCHQLSDEELWQGQQERTDPDDSQLSGGGSAVLDHLVVHLDVGGRAEAVDAQSTQGEGGHTEGGHLRN